MKKSLLILTTVGAMASAFGQGTVNFSNLSTALTSPPDRLVRYDATAASLNSAFVAGAPVFSNSVPGLRAQLYVGDSTTAEGSLIPTTAAPATFRGSTSASVGAWFNAVRTISQVTTPTVNLEVRVWDSSLASSYEAAVALGAAYTGLLGHSAMFSYTYPTSATPAPSESNMNAFQGFTIGVVAVPEPATFALAGLGALSVLLFRRRK